MLHICEIFKYFSHSKGGLGWLSIYLSVAGCCLEIWFIKLKFFQLSLVLKRKGTLNRNLVVCASLVSGFSKATESVSVVKKIFHLCVYLCCQTQEQFFTAHVLTTNWQIRFFFPHRQQTEHTSHSFPLKDRALFLQGFIWRGQQNFIILTLLK